MRQVLIVFLFVLLINGIMLGFAMNSKILLALETVQTRKYSVAINNKLQSGVSTANLSNTDTLLCYGEQKYSFEIQADEGGDIPAGLDISVNGVYQAGEVITIAARAMPGYRFVRWSSSGGGSFADERNSQTQFTMPAEDVIIHAHFSAL